MNLFAPTLAFLTCAWLTQAADSTQPLTADAIMQAVAANQNRGQAERAQYLYDQHVKVIVRRTNGKLAREETTDLLVVPGPKAVTKKEQSVKGRYWKKNHYLDFTGTPVPDAGGIDYSLVDSFTHDLTNDDSKDGLAKDLFPLTTEAQKDLQFELIGEQVVQGRAAYRVRFRPKDASDITWAGEALIDKEELQPVSVYTRLSRRLPMLVRTLLGTDLPGLGFSTRYERVGKDIWFPVSFGTEFRLRAVFFINRDISVSLENRNFKRTAAESTIQYASQQPNGEAGPR